MVMKRNSHPLAGKTVYLKTKDNPDFSNGDKFRVEDWWINLYGKPWGFSDGNPAALRYAIRSSLLGLPRDDDVVYGKVGPFGYLVHVSELGEEVQNDDS